LVHMLNNKQARFCNTFVSSATNLLAHLTLFAATA